jgi:hypothetical protein
MKWLHIKKFAIVRAERYFPMKISMVPEPKGNLRLLSNQKAAR